jgi:hypothetical protein
MAQTPRIDWKIAGFKKLRKSPEMQALLQEIVDEMLADLGDGYEGDVQEGRTRARGLVATDSFEARRDNATNQALLRALAKARRDG